MHYYPTHCLKGYFRASINFQNQEVQDFQSSKSGSRKMKNMMKVTQNYQFSFVLRCSMGSLINLGCMQGNK